MAQSKQLPEGFIPDKPSTPEGFVPDGFVPDTEDISTEPSMLDNIWNAVTTSILPDLPEERLVPPEMGTHPHLQAARYGEELGRSAYENVVQPLGSIAGAGLAMFGGPIARGALRVASRIPGASAVKNLLNTNVLPGEAPTLVKNTISSLTPKPSAPTLEKIVSPKVDTPVPEGHVRVYRGEPKNTTESGGWWTTKPENARNYAANAKGGGKVLSMDLPKDIYDDLIKNMKSERVELPGERMELGTYYPKTYGTNVFEPDVPEWKPVSSLDKLRTALEESKPVSRKQAQILSSERGKKFGEASQVDITDSASAGSFMSKLKGEHTKVVREPLMLEQPDVDSLYKMIGENLNGGKISVPESARTVVGLGKLLEGSNLQANEIEILSRTFGPEIMGLAESSSAREMVLKTVNIPKSLVSAIDFGIPFRQGFNRVGQREWFGMLRPMVESYLSEGYKKKWVDAIKETRNFDYFRSNGLVLYDDIKPSGTEDVVSSFVKDLPGVKHSNRAFNIGISKLRLDTANTLYDDYDRLYRSSLTLAGTNPNRAVSEKLFKEAELFNPNNDFLAKKIANLVNTSTGRGSLGKLEPIAEELNAVFFSPALMSSRFKSIHRVLNPMSYITKDPVERKDALKQLLSMTGTVMTTTALLKAGGAEVSLDPRSSDFLKGKIGDFRFDLSGGYLQYFVAPAKILSGSSVSTRTGNVNELNSGKFGSQTMFDVAEQFFINKEAPIASLATSYLRGVEPTGRPTNFTASNPFENTAVKMVIPIMVQDMVELGQEDPGLIPFMIPSAFGGSVAVHDDFRGSGERNKLRRRQ